MSDQDMREDKKKAQVHLPKVQVTRRPITRALAKRRTLKGSPSSEDSSGNFPKAHRWIHKDFSSSSYREPDSATGASQETSNAEDSESEDPRTRHPVPAPKAPQAPIKTPKRPSTRASDHDVVYEPPLHNLLPQSLPKLAKHTPIVGRRERPPGSQPRSRQEIKAPETVHIRPIQSPGSPASQRPSPISNLPRRIREIWHTLKEQAQRGRQSNFDDDPFMQLHRANESRPAGGRSFPGHQTATRPARPPKASAPPGSAGQPEFTGFRENEIPQGPIGKAIKPPRKRKVWTRISDSARPKRNTRKPIRFADYTE